MKKRNWVKWAVQLAFFTAGFFFLVAIPPQVKGARLLQTYDCSTQASISLTECEALVAVYTETNDLRTPDPWTNEDDWLGLVEPCTWYGITCGPGPGTPPFVVTELDLSSNNLTGRLPIELGDLTNLTLLDISDNSLTGPLPEETGNLSLLVTLNVAANPDLTGPLPAELENLTVLTSLDFSGTNLCEPQEASFQTWLGGVVSISDSGLLCEIDCAIQTSVPQSECTALFALYNATDGDAWIDNEFWLYNYDLCTWFGVTCSATNVTEIALANNNLDGTLPGQIGAFPYMSDLNLGGNSLTGSLPNQLQLLVNLQILNLADNDLSGTLPSSMGNLLFLASLDLANNSFNGEVPVSFANLTNMTYLDTTGSTLCLPDNASLLSWYAGITSVDTINPCEKTPTPTNTGVPITLTPTPIPLPTKTPTATSTPTITPTPTMLGQFQTLTAFAVEDTLTATANWWKTPTLDATATKYYILVSQTLMPGDQPSETPGGAAVDAGGDSSEDSSSLGERFRPFLWGVLILAIILIAAGIFLELRNRRKRTSRGD